MDRISVWGVAAGIVVSVASFYLSVLTGLPLFPVWFWEPAGDIMDRQLRSEDLGLLSAFIIETDSKETEAPILTA